MARDRSFFDPNVRQYLLEEERVVDEVFKHWICWIFPVAITLGGVVVILFSVLFAHVWPFWVLAGTVICLIGMWRFLDVFRYRFIVTNMRVFRVQGVLSRKVATIPLNRILDISYQQTLWSRIFGYGHFRFESAAGVQGLSDVEFVSNPKKLDHTIQTVIQSAGLRAIAETLPEEEDGT